MSVPRDAIPTQQVLLPGQQLSMNVPWERDDRPPPPVIRPVIAQKGNTFDARELQADVISGVYIGDCQVIRRLIPGSANHLLALRDTFGRGLVPVVMRKLDVADVYAREIETYAEAAGKLEHPHLAQVFPCESTDEGIFWVTALVSGATLAEISDACVKAGKAVPVGIALAAVHEAALALSALHAPPGEAHALLCDQSLVVGFDGAARLLDVGLFRALRHQSLWPEVMDRIGPYLAPEQVLRGHMPDPRSDVYSLAALLHAFLSGGRTPAALSFDQRAELHRKGGYPAPSSLNVSLSTRVDEVVLKALSEDPLQRYPNAVEFAHALKGAAAELFWRPELRAQFVGSLFGERKRREEVLFAATSDDPKEGAMARPAHDRSKTPPWANPAYRPPPIPKAHVKTSLKKKKYALGAPTPNIPTRPERAISDGPFSAAADDLPYSTGDVPFVDSEDVEAVWPDDGDEYTEGGRIKPKLRPLWLTLLAVALTWFWQQGVLLDEVPATALSKAAAWEQAARAQVFPVKFWSPAPVLYSEPIPAHPERAKRVEGSAPVEAKPVESKPIAAMVGTSTRPAASLSANGGANGEPASKPSLPELAWAPLSFSDGPVVPYAAELQKKASPSKVSKLKKKTRPGSRDAAKARRARR